jgi:hypothetical protein
MLRDMALPLVDSTHQWILDELDADQNGSISFAEFVRWWRILDAKLCFVKYAGGDQDNEGGAWSQAAAKLGGLEGAAAAAAMLVEQIHLVDDMHMSVGALQQLLHDMGFYNSYKDKSGASGPASPSHRNMEAAAGALLKQLDIDIDTDYDGNGKPSPRSKVQGVMVSFDQFLVFLTRTTQEATRTKLRQLYNRDSGMGDNGGGDSTAQSDRDYEAILLEHHANESYLQLASAQTIASSRIESKMRACMATISEKHGIDLKELMDDCKSVLGGSTK